MNLRLLFFCVGTLCLLVLFSGCSNGYVGMKGRVTYSDNGEPLELGTVTFTSDMFQARGNIKEDGVYEMGSYGDSDGLPPGTYTVFVSGAVIVSGPIDKLIKTPLVDEKYTSPRTSPLSITVDKTTKNYDFTVERKK